LIATEEGIPYDQAVRRVVDQTGEKAIRIEVLTAVRNALEGEVERAPTPRRSIVVTGSGGFLGSRLAEALLDAHDVAAPTRDEVDLTRDAVALDLFVREHAADTVVHLANPRIYTTNDSFGEVLAQLKNVADVCVAHDAHLIFPSTWEVFSGYRSTGLLVDEGTVPRPASNYGHAKLLCEHLLHQMHAAVGLRYTLLRIGPVYGATSPRPKFIWNFIGKALGGAPVVTHRYRNGDPALDLVHVDDAIDFLLAAVERSWAGILHAGTGVTTTTAEIARMIVASAGSASHVSYQEIDGYAANIALDPSLAQENLGWAPSRTLAEELPKLVDEIMEGAGR